MSPVIFTAMIALVIGYAVGFAIGWIILRRWRKSQAEALKRELKRQNDLAAAVLVRKRA